MAVDSAANRIRAWPVRLIPDIAYGTADYPEKVARRLRAVNIAAWTVAALTVVFAVGQFLDPAPGMWKPATANALYAPAFAAIPLLHRYGPLMAPVALLSTAYVAISVLILLFGIGNGMFIYFLMAPALAVLFLGTERLVLAGGFSVIAVALMLALLALVPHNTGLQSDRALFITGVVPTAAASAALLFVIVQYAMRQIASAEATVEREYERSESLLVNILPPPVAERLKTRRDAVIADRYDDASILFADMAGFTARASDTPPDELVLFLNTVYSRLDALVERHGLEKIKTTGDAYMVVSGVPEARTDHAEALADLALDMQAALVGLVDARGRAVPVRIGIASGPVVAGIVGTRKFFYDVWGDAVNTAARMESTGKAGRIHVAPATWVRLAGRYDLEDRGPIEVRGKGMMRTSFLIGRKAADGGEAREG
ncbi:MAG TPA: adenylate/guanylate cyclase domain-containing protein [Vineibacter sp.]|nr:adenylate/guanylate cyclase domain-containing protein [Vineibacter sp.]